MKNIFNPPTDNLHKFKAIFGLLLILGAMALLQYGATNTVAQIEGRSIQILKLRSEVLGIEQIDFTNNHWFKVEKIEVLEGAKNFYMYMSSVQFIFGYGMLIIGCHQVFFGFWKWRRLTQPLQDEKLKADLEHRKLEVEILRSQIATENNTKTK